MKTLCHYDDTWIANGRRCEEILIHLQSTKTLLKILWLVYEHTESLGTRKTVNSSFFFLNRKKSINSKNKSVGNYKIKSKHEIRKYSNKLGIKKKEEEKTI